MTLEDLNFVIRQLREFISNEGIDDELNGSEVRVKEITKGGTIDVRVLKMVLQFNTDFINKLKSFSTILWSDEQIEILNQLGLGKLFGHKKEFFFSKIESANVREPNVIVAAIKTLNEEVSSALKILGNGVDLLDRLGFGESVVAPEVDSVGVVEIIFDKDVSIDNFDEAKDQMKSWYLIIEGYSRLLSIPREEFVIVGFSKNSPTKIKVQVKVDVAEIIAAVGNFVLGAYGMYLTTVKSIDAIESSVFISNEVKVQMVDTARKDLDAGIKTYIQEIVDKEIDNRVKDRKDKEEVRVALTKGLTQQFNFTQHGGSINLYVGGNEQSDEIKQFEKTKQKIQLLERGVSKQKLIEDTISEDDENGNDENGNDENEKHGDYLNLED